MLVAATVSQHLSIGKMSYLVFPQPVLRIAGNVDCLIFYQMKDE